MSLEETQDAELLETNGVFDFQIDSDGDIKTKDFFDTSLLMTIFCERRALESEMPASHLRRGWIGNLETPGFEIGSKLWLYYQARRTNKTKNGANTALTNGFKWLVDGGYALSYDVVTTLTSTGASALVTIKRSNSKVEKRLFELWDNTGQ